MLEKRVHHSHLHSTAHRLHNHLFCRRKLCENQEFENQFANGRKFAILDTILYLFVYQVYTKIER